MSPSPNYDGIFVLAQRQPTIGGTASSAGNVISGNDVSPSAYTGLSAYFAGIQLMFGGQSAYDTTGNVVLGNLIGLNADGQAIAGATNTGVYVNYDSSGNTIGGTSPGARNVISGDLNGVEMFGDSGDVVVGNYIGTDTTGTAAIGNEQLWQRAVRRKLQRT